MKQRERSELDYSNGFSDGDSHCKKKKPLPAWAKGSKIDPPISVHYGNGFRDGAHGKAHRYAKGTRKGALV
jgi:hypothetical protein